MYFFLRETGFIQLSKGLTMKHYSEHVLLFTLMLHSCITIPLPLATCTPLFLTLFNIVTIVRDDPFCRRIKSSKFDFDFTLRKERVCKDLTVDLKLAYFNYMIFYSMSV